MKIQTSILILCGILLFSCKEPFNPEIPAQETNYLVVEGFINAGNEPTNIRLSRTTQWNEDPKLKPESAASVSIEGDDNTSFLLAEQSNGLYSLQVPVDKNVKYRLHIKTKGNEEYLSDYVDVKITPAIDSVNWKVANEGLQIFANAHDAQNATRYYRWDYDETWEIRSYFDALYEFKNGSIVERDVSENIFYCWKYSSSTAIILGSSARLESDVIFESPVLMIPKNSEKLAVRYSILLKQYALPKDAYEFFEMMKKNTESVGSIFDPQPSALKSNIHNVTGQRNVIGFMYASTKVEKRMFVTKSELPSNWSFYLPCETKEVANHPDSIRFYIPLYWPYNAKREGPFIVAWFAASPICVDCRLRNGSNVKPSYW